jgi:mRNA interferase YafQ
MKLFRRTSRFKRDVKRLQRQGKDLEKLKDVLQALVQGEALADRYRDHVLVGQYKGTRECHLEPDCLLIYESAETELVLIRTGSHSDLFA